MTSTGCDPQSISGTSATARFFRPLSICGFIERALPLFLLEGFSTKEESGDCKPAQLDLRCDRTGEPASLGLRGAFESVGPYKAKALFQSICMIGHDVAVNT